jgi:hypothetical protein
MGNSMKRRKTLEGWFKRSGAFRWANRPRFTEPVFQSYVRSIGQLLLAWNDLHERLATLFVAAMGAGWVDRYLAVWHEVRSDKTKREMLQVAIARLPDSEKAGREKIVAEITWILDHAKPLEGLRDDAAHTPLRYLFAGLTTDIRNAFISPSTSFQNPRAIRLEQKGKSLLTEYQYARERLVVLRDYAIAIDAAWGNGRLPWPDRPDLPDRKPTRRSKGRVSRRNRK